MPDVMTQPWRVGRSVGRTLYAVFTYTDDGEEHEASVLLGMVDTPELAEHIVAVHNASLAVRP